ncbi:MAG: winged helix DNA-binding domain-containing protein [Acidimicrobiia bacterium]
MSRSRPTPELQLTWDQVLSWRVDKQLLPDPLPDALRVISTLGGVQVQLASAAIQVIAIRSTSVPDLDRLLWEERSLVKTWVMRGTLHLLPADELGTWIAALRQREWRITPAWEKYHGVTKAQLEAITAAIPLVVSDAPQTREELAEAIVARVGDPGLGEALSSGWSQVLKPAANQGLLAQGPPRGQNVTFVDPRRWLADAPAEPEPEVAMRTVIERFLDSNGPATTEDFARWLGLSPKSGRELMSPHLDDLVPVSVEGDVHWLTAAGAKAAAGAAPVAGVYLLPGFDPYTLAPISHRRHTIPPGKVDRVSRTAGQIAPVILEGGRIIGTWESGKDEVIRLQPFAGLSKAQLASIRDHVEHRYQGLLGSPDLMVSDAP